jgi:hypothetical protein
MISTVLVNEFLTVLTNKSNYVLTPTSVQIDTFPVEFISQKYLVSWLLMALTYITSDHIILFLNALEMNRTQIQKEFTQICLAPFMMM